MYRPKLRNSNAGPVSLRGGGALEAFGPKGVGIAWCSAGTTRREVVACSFHVWPSAAEAVRLSARCQATIQRGLQELVGAFLADQG